MSYGTDLYRWVRDNDYFDPPPGVQHPIITHNEMRGNGGGKLYIPERAYDHFLELYGNDLYNGDHHYLSENRTDVFRLIVDLDIKRPDQVPYDEVQQYCIMIHNTVKKFYPLETPQKIFDMIICKRRESKHAKDDSIYWKYGFHIYFPYLYVDSIQARTMRQAFIGRLAVKFGQNPGGQNEWEDVVDECVYQSNGLRMVGSRKAQKCKVCKGKECKNCDRGIVTLGADYKMHDYISDSKSDPEKIRFYKERIHSLVRMTSVRLPSQTVTTPGWEPYEGAPSLSASEKSRNRPRGTEVPKDSRYAAVQNYLRRHTHDCYKNLVVKKITQSANGKRYYINVIGDGSSYCLNYNRSHTTNSIYFLLTERCLVQKCYCRCNTTIGRSMMCKDWVSEPFRLTQPLRQMFFPDERGGFFQFSQERNRTTRYGVDKGIVSKTDRLHNVMAVVHKLQVFLEKARQTEEEERPSKRRRVDD